MSEVTRRMKTTTRGIAITGALFFGLLLTARAYCQEADDSPELAQDLERSENNAFVGADQDFGDLTDRAEKSVKNEITKDVALLKQTIKTPTPAATPSVGAIPTRDDSLEQIEREVDSLEAQSKALSQ